MRLWDNRFESKLVHNERVKYMATYLNNAGVGALLIGTVTPIFTTVSAGWFVAGGILLGAAFNGFAQLLLGSLRE